LPTQSKEGQSTMQRTLGDCLALDANTLAKGGWFGSLTGGNITWTNGSQDCYSGRLFCDCKKGVYGLKSACILHYKLAMKSQYNQ
jgi:hypothetical protein